MKCNIAQDLLPLYAEGLCSEETSRELEEHFAECKECSSLKNDLPLPEKSVGGDIGKDIKPFKKIHRRLKVNIFIIIALGLVTAAILFFLGGLTYGELNPRSGWLNFSTIARNIEVRKIAKLLEKGDIDGFAKHIHISDAWHVTDGSNAPDALIENFKSAYRSEFGGKNCKITNVDTTILVYWSDYHELISDVTFDFDGEPLSMQFRKNSEGYDITVCQGWEGSQSRLALELLSYFDYILEEISILSVEPWDIVPVFGNNMPDIVNLYRNFSEDGSEIVSAYASQPVFDAETGVLKSQCCFKFSDNDGNTAILEFTAELKNGRFFSADMSTVEVINQGMSDEKLEQVFDILRASA